MTEQPPPNLRQVSAELAQALGETEREPLALLWRIVRLCGPAQARAWLAEAQQIEAAGGMRTADGTRRRTPGGVFFTHVRDALMDGGRKKLAYQIFWAGKGKPAGSQPGAPAQSSPPSPAQTWADRGALIGEASTATGKATTVKVTIIGRPGKTIVRDQFTLLRLTHSGPLPALPKGIPVPAKIPETTYVVYIGAKQWKGVAEAIKNPDDALIIEGAQLYDAEFTAIAVFATNTTTKLLQQAKRQPKAEG